MTILSHRGFWKKPSEKNSITAFERSFSQGFGTETDLRVFQDELYISHDAITSADELLTATEFFELHAEYDSSLPLALNIKEDGLQDLIKSLIQEYKIKNYFLFDMTPADLKTSLQHSLQCYTRISDVEPDPIYLSESQGLWVDSMKSEWITETAIQKLLQYQKPLCVVSSELHSRPYENLWQVLKNFKNEKLISICTDHPQKFQEFLSR